VSLSTQQLNERLAVVKQKAAKYHIPWEILWGVEGKETTHGNNVATSSAGAKGAFQFIAPTAAAYRYPYTNEQTPQIYAAQADAAAHYLSDLISQHGGNWEAALRAYSGGGYGYSEVLTDARGDETKPSVIPGVGDVVKGSPLAKPQEAIESLFNGKWGKLLVDGVLLLAGAVLVVYGIMVAVRPRESAFSVPLPKAVPVPV